MILTALVLAAGVAMTPAPGAAEPMPGPARRGEFDDGINLYRVPARCSALGDAVTRRIRTSVGGRLHAQYAVTRQIDGCAVPAPAGYHPDYLLPGRWDAPAVAPGGDKPNEKR